MHAHTHTPHHTHTARTHAHTHTHTLTTECPGVTRVTGARAIGAGGSGFDIRFREHLASHLTAKANKGS